LVALGQNENLNKLKNSLNEAQQQYATLQVRYPMGTKKMSSLKQNINELTEQIQTESTLTIGKEVKPSDQKNIKDTVRTKMVNDLVESQDEVDSLLSEKQVLAHTLSMLKAEQNNLPDQQKTLGDLLEKETNLSQVVNTLSTKLVEAKVRESEISSNITIVQNPTTPEKAPFPTRTHTMALFTLAGLLAGVFTVLSKHYYRNKAGNLNEVESILEAPVLTNLSWLPAASYHSNHVSTSTGILQEYQKLVTALKIKKEDLGLSVIGFSHLGKGARRANIINNIATQLANCHYTVLIINANFERTVPSSDFGFDITTSPDFKKLLIRKEESLLLQDYVVRIDPKRSIYLMSSPDTVLSSYELVNSKKFPVIINEMKKQFDFVLVDMPEILYSPDSVVIARMLDGVVSICGVDTTKEDLLETRKTCQRNAINLVGAITKDCN
jgi:Mrp family chromosome partitioning ATPase